MAATSRSWGGRSNHWSTTPVFLFDRFIVKRMNKANEERKVSKRPTILNQTLGPDAKPYHQVRHVQLPAGENRWSPDVTGYEGLGISNTVPKSNVTPYMRDKIDEVRHQSQGYPTGDESSDGES